MGLSLLEKMDLLDEFEQVVAQLTNASTDALSKMDLLDRFSELVTLLTGATAETDPYLARIEALKTLPLEQYEIEVDKLIAEIGNHLPTYEATLLDIDQSRDDELKAYVMKKLSEFA